MTGVLYAMVGKVTRFSDPQVILVSCSLIGIGLVLILAGVNFASMSRYSGRGMYLLAFSILGIWIFVTSYPEKWSYPTVAYALILYSLGIFLILLNIFVNCFTLSNMDTSCAGSATEYRSEDHPCYPELSGGRDSSVMATFAGILLAGILPDNLQSSLHNGNSAGNKHAHLDRQIDPVDITDGETISKVVMNPVFTLDSPEANEEAPGGTVPEEAPWNGSAASQALAVQLPSEAEEGPVVADIPFQEFVSMKKTGIKTDDTMREAARKLLMFQFGRMAEHERGTKVGRDIEELHDMRVAAMRMRSVFQVLEEYLDMKMLDRHLKNLRSTRRALGQVRDLDVFLEKIDHYLEEQPQGGGIDLGHLTDSLHIEKAKRRGMMLIYLDGAKYDKFKSRFSRILLDKSAWQMRPVTKNSDPVPCRVKDLLPVLLYSQLAGVRSYDDIVSAGSSPTLEQYHQLRIDVKILRYTLEFFREVLGPQSKELIQDLKNLQDNLGDMHDAVVALELLENFEKYGRWGVTEDRHPHLQVPALKEPGVEAYIEYRRQELERLIREFPVAWSKVCDNGFSIKLSQIIAGMYSE